MKKFILNLTWLFTVIISVHAQPSAQQTKLEQYLKIQQSLTGFSGTVLVQKANKIILSASTGMASIEHGVPVSESTVFHVASITKSFTALLTLLAVEEGKLKLSDSIGKYFPEIPEAQWRSITIHQLLCHRSGIPHNEGIPGYWSEKSTISFDRVPAMKEIFSMKLAYAPGTMVSYSSPGYFVLASILENIYGKNFGLLLREKIIVPLALKHTGQLDNRTLIPNLTQGYDWIGGRPVLARYRSYSLMKGPGDLYASAQDLAILMQNLLGQQWNRKTTDQLFFQHSKEPIKREDYYGYGWFIRKASANRPEAYYHGGGSYGTSALIAMYPEEKLTVVVLSNVSSLPVQEIWEDVEKIAREQPLTLPVIRNDQPVNLNAIKMVTGVYHADNGMLLTISTMENKLFAKLGENTAFEIFMEEPLHFYGKKVSVDLIFEPDEHGKAKAVTAKRMGAHFMFLRK